MTTTMELTIPPPPDDKSDTDAWRRRREAVFAARENSISIMDLTSERCAWPLGEIGTEAFGYCGAPVESGKPYCGCHSRIAYAGRGRR